jgi:N-acetylmuramoyl-L-alanine amidase
MKYKAIFDIGHGDDTYRNTGSKGVPGLEEFEFNNQVVKYAKELAEHNGIEVILTQPFYADEVDLLDRSKHANSTDATVLISFHADANDNPNARGHWVFYWHTSEEGRKLAKLWDNYARAILPNPARPIQQSKPGEWTNFHILRETKQYAILCEHGFMTNADDLQLLKDEVFRYKCAEVAVRTLCEYWNISFKYKEIDYKTKYFALLDKHYRLQREIEDLLRKHREDDPHQDLPIKR